MHVSPISHRQVFCRLCIVFCIALGACSPSPPPPQKGPPTAIPQAQAPSGAVAALDASKGEAALPPNHPPLLSHTAPASVAGAGSSAADNREIASRHPTATGKTKLSVSIPDNVKGKWASATLAVKSGGAEEIRKVALGEQVALGGTQQLRLLHYLPAYTSDFQTVTSSSGEELNPAVQIQLLDAGQVVSEGWVFQKLPEFNSFRSERVAVRLVSAQRSGDK